VDRAHDPVNGYDDTGVKRRPVELDDQDRCRMHVRYVVGIASLFAISGHRVRLGDQRRRRSARLTSESSSAATGSTMMATVAWMTTVHVAGRGAIMLSGRTGRHFG
jgi:hypothetical protein